MGQSPCDVGFDDVRREHPIPCFFAEAAARIRRLLTANRPNANARFVDMQLSATGLQVSRS